jgi:hypothetical protein
MTGKNRGYKTMDKIRIVNRRASYEAGITGERAELPILTFRLFRNEMLDTMPFGNYPDYFLIS